MNEDFRLPPIRMAEVFIDGRCVGFLSDVRLSREEGGSFTLEGEWSGYSDVFDKGSLFTIAIPRHDYKFLSDKVKLEGVGGSGRISFKDASFLPESPNDWLDHGEGLAEA
jgi:hypothetical protein